MDKKSKSIKPKKQRKMHYSKPIHANKEDLMVHLSKDLRQETGKRALMARVDDKVKVLRGSFKGKKGKVLKVEHKKCRIFVDKLTRKKSDGTERLIPFIASNLLLTDLNRDDEKRFKKTKAGKPSKTEQKTEVKE